ncbi:MAG: hypothetical protein HY801_03295 [Candidatus Lindowbacteria bacterium]|nr:hypothetical protein [Candidatus Lindowbacteria bacterium]
MDRFLNQFWQAYLVNFLFWTSLAQGAVVFAAVLDITNARWGRRYVQLSRYFAGFLPVGVVLFAVLLLGRNHIFPWIAHAIPGKEAYLNVPFLAARGLLGLAVLTALSWKFMSETKDRYSDVGRSGASPWSVILVMAFMLVYSVIAIDLIMSLQPHWHSTLLGAHYAVGSLYLGMAGLCLAGFIKAGVPRDDRQKLCQLVFGFSLFWVSLLWSQYIVIWYGDVPNETGFVYLRFYQMPWKAVTLLVLALGFILPFFSLMSRRAKLIGIVPFFGSVCVFIGLLLEKYGVCCFVRTKFQVFCPRGQTLTFDITRTTESHQ